jgi:all-beta uncharacterized protein/uncharacterized protein DUF5666
MRNRILVAAIAAACAAFASNACSKTETSITAPSSDRCDLTATGTPVSFPPPGGQGSLTILTTRDCTWSVATDAGWVTIAGDRSGQGEATVRYTVAPNPVPSPRSGALVVGGQSVAVSQQGAPCVFSLSRTNDTIDGSGGRLTVGVTTLSGCHWTANAGTAWINVVSGQSGDASGTVGLSIAANAGAARNGQVTIAGQAYTVSQKASTPPPPTPDPTPTPSPTPDPPPTPGARHVSFSGTATNVSGRCPNVTFSVGGNSIVADDSTDFKSSKCGDLQNGRDVDGEGDVQPSGVIRATRLRVGKND